MAALNRRRLLQIAGVATAAGAMAACGATPAPAATSAPATEATQPPAEEAQPTTAPAQTTQKAELRYVRLSMSEEVAKYFEGTAIPAFEAANPGVTVKVDMSDWGHLGEKLMTSFAGNLPVDLVETGSDWVGPYAARKQFMPLDDMIAKDYQEEIKDFYPEMVEISRYAGKLCGLPHVLDIRTMAYRKDQFEEAGLDPATGPDTWDDLVTYATKLVQTDSGGTITRAGYILNATGPADAFFQYWYLLVQNGMDVIVPWGSWKTEDLKLETPEAKEALQFMIALITEHKVSPITGMSTKNPDLSALAEGVGSMETQGSWIISNFKRYSPDLLPVLGIGKPLMRKARKQYACPNVHAMGTNTKNPELAWELMKHMVSQETLTGILSPESATPPRKSIAADAEYMQDPMLKSFQAIPEEGWGTTTPQATEWPTLENIGNYIQAALRLEMTVDEALAKAQEDTKRRIEELVAATGAG